MLKQLYTENVVAQCVKTVKRTVGPQYLVICDLRREHSTQLGARRLACCSTTGIHGLDELTNNIGRPWALGIGEPLGRLRSFRIR